MDEREELEVLLVDINTGKIKIVTVQRKESHNAKDHHRELLLKAAQELDMRAVAEEQRRWENIMRLGGPGHEAELHDVIRQLDSMVVFHPQVTVDMLSKAAARPQHNFPRAEAQLQEKILKAASRLDARAVAEEQSRWRNIIEGVGPVLQDALSKVRHAIVSLSGNPKSSSHYGERVLDVLKDVEILRRLESRYSVSYEPNPLQPRLTPGPEPRTPEELIEIVEEWRKWKKCGYSQQEFSDFKGWKSRTILSKALRWYRVQFGANSI